MVASSPVRFLIPTEGWSSISVQGQTLYDPEADRVFVEELRKNLRPEIEVKQLQMTLDNPEFARAIVEAFNEMMQTKKSA